MIQGASKLTVAERKARATAIKTTKLSGIQLASKALKKEADTFTAPPKTLLMKDKIEEQDEKEDNNDDEDNDNDNDKQDKEEKEERGPKKGLVNEQKKRKAQELKKAPARKVPKLDAETLLQDPSVAPLFQTAEERQTDTDGPSFVVKAYFSDSTEVYRRISEEAELSDAQKRALEKAAAIRTATLTDGAFVVMAPIKRLIAAVIQMIVEKEVPVLQYQSIDKKTGELVDRKPMRISADFIDSLAKEATRFVTEALHGAKLAAANARRLTVGTDDLDVYFNASTLARHQVHFGESNQVTGVSSICDLINQRKEGRKERLALTAEQRKVAKAARDAEYQAEFKVRAALAEVNNSNGDDNEEEDSGGEEGEGEEGKDEDGEDK